MKILFLLLLFSSASEAVQTPIVTNCFVRKESFLVATTVSVLVASSLSDVNCWIIQNRDGTNPIYGSINASTNSSSNYGFEIQAGGIYQLYTGPFNNLYMRSSTGSIIVDILSGRTND